LYTGFVFVYRRPVLFIPAIAALSPILCSSIKTRKGIKPLPMWSTSTAQGGAVASVASLAADGLFLDPATGKNTGIVAVLMRLAEEADEARRRF
jgi:hypothetical protein